MHRQRRHDLVDVLQALEALALRADAIEVADIGILPDAAFEGMAVPLDEARQDHLVAKAIVEIELAPALELIERAGPQDPPVAHSDVAGEGLAGIHRQDATGRIDSGGHDRGFFRFFCE